MSNNKDKKGSKSKYNLRNKKNDDKTKLKKGSIDPDSEPEEEDTSDEEIDMKEYRKLLSTMFPSKYMKDKTKNLKRVKENVVKMKMMMTMMKNMKMKMKMKMMMKIVKLKMMMMKI